MIAITILGDFCLKYFLLLIYLRHGFFLEVFLRCERWTGSTGRRVRTAARWSWPLFGKHRCFSCHFLSVAHSKIQLLNRHFRVLRLYSEALATSRTLLRIFVSFFFGLVRKLTLAKNGLNVYIVYGKLWYKSRGLS